MTHQAVRKGGGAHARAAARAEHVLHVQLQEGYCDAKEEHTSLVRTMALRQWYGGFLQSRG